MSGNINSLDVEKNSGHGKAERRHLRSENDVKVKNHLFNFENVNPLLYRGQKIKVAEETSFDDLYVSNKEAESGPVPSLKRSLDVKVVNDILPRRSKHVDDPLPEDKYDPFHKRFQKKEKIMTNMDQQRIMLDVDNLNSSYIHLQSGDWVRYLPKVTYIKNMKDLDNLEYIREITMNEIERLVRKYENWKRRKDVLEKDIKRFHMEQGNPDSIEDEYILPLKEIRIQRKKEERKRYGPLVKLILNNGYTLIMDPVSGPSISPTVSSNSLVSSRSNDDSEKFYHHKGNSRYRHNGIDDLMPNLAFDRDEGIAFGNKIPILGEAFSEFSLNSQWKRRASAWLPEREDLRKRLRKESLNS